MGKIISLSGIDGAGKSTQVKLLLSYLKQRGKKVKNTQEAFGYYLLKPLIGILRSATGSPSYGPVKQNTGNIAKSWFIVAFVDIWFGYIFKIRPMLKNYDYLIADRFYNDIWANLLYYGYLPTFAFGFFLKLLPKSDVAFLFMVKPENGKKRSDDFPLSYFERQNEIYKSLTKYSSYYVIDANKPPQDIFNKVKKILNKDKRLKIK